MPTTMLASLVNIYSCVSDVYMDDIADMACRFTIYIWINILIKKNMIIIHDIDVSYIMSLLQLKFIYWQIENIQHSLLNNTHYNNIAFQKYDQKQFETLMLEIYVFIESSLTIVYLEVISNIQCQIFTRKHCFTIEKNKGIMTPTMLDFFVNINRFVSDIYRLQIRHHISD